MNKKSTRKSDLIIGLQMSRAKRFLSQFTCSNVFFSILEWHKFDSMNRRYGPYHWTESKSLSSSWNNPLDLNYIWRNIMDSTGGLYTTSTVHFLVSFCQPLKKSKRATKRLSWGGWRLVEQCPLLIQLQKKGRLEGGKKFSPYLFFWS